MPAANADSVWERVVADLATALADITEAGGYGFDASVTRVGDATLKSLRAGSRMADRSVVVVMGDCSRVDDGDQRSPTAGGLGSVWELSIGVLVTRTPTANQAESSTPRDRVIANAVSDVMRAAFVDPSRGGLCERFDAEGWDPAEDYANATVTFIARLVTSEFDPRTPATEI
ncbi:MAG: hypothetical protein AAGI54_04135 [Planctomycetota bacterium]